MKRVRQIADSRVVAGVHYASDTEAGLALGDLQLAQIETQPRFQTHLSFGRKRVSYFRLLPPCHR